MDRKQQVEQLPRSKPIPLCMYRDLIEELQKSLRPKLLRLGIEQKQPKVPGRRKRDGLSQCTIFFELGQCKDHTW